MADSVAPQTCPICQKPYRGCPHPLSQVETFLEERRFASAVRRQTFCSLCGNFYSGQTNPCSTCRDFVPTAVWRQTPGEP